MPEDIGALRGELAETRADGEGFFTDAKKLLADQSNDAKQTTYTLWSLPEDFQTRAKALRSRIERAANRISGLMKKSPLCGDPDQSRLRLQVNLTTAALKFQRYEYQPPF